MTIGTRPVERPAPVRVVWGARTFDHAYRVDAVVRQLACNAPPETLVFDFDGHGPLTPLEFYLGTANGLLLQGYKIEHGSLTETTFEDVDQIMAGQVETRLTQGVDEPARVHALAPRPNRAQRRKRRR